MDQYQQYQQQLSPGPIEAGSLSTITPIADDPPIQFILPPTSTPGEREEKYPRPALVLYFVRVPGSRDLFLTPMHPLKSTVTGQDIEGCLYYVHVHGEGGGYSSHEQQQGHGGRPPLLSASSSGSGRRRWSAHNILHHSRKGEGDMKDFSMTIIRRDPATGAQWNVAHISSMNSSDAVPGGVQMLTSQDGRQSPIPPPPPIVISLPGSGYKKFMLPSSITRKPIHRNGNELQYSLPPLPPPPQPPLVQQGRSVRPEEEEAYFRRKREYQEILAARDRQIQQLELEQAEREREMEMAEEERGLIREVVWNSAAAGAGDKWWKMGMSKTKRHLRTTSTGSGGFSGGDRDKEKKHKDHWKGYAFDALWGQTGNASRGQKTGTCRFKDVAGGKITKCKYYPPDGSESWLVSAIEFKLPSSGGFHRTRSPSPSPLGGGNVEGSGMEGSEKGAGGGGGGGADKAKLGTFVVHNAGMEMLDLVVSANVGLFWRKWEGWVGERGALGQ